MIYSFGDLELDDQRFELRRSGQPIPVEPQVFVLLCRIFAGQGRLVTKDELVEAVWNGRAVSDASIASRMRAARAAIGDDGDRQEIIRTVHGRGFRAVPAVRILDRQEGGLPPRPDAPSLAVLPFRGIGLPPDQSVLTEALAHEILRALSRLRWLLVISRGSSFRFARPSPETGERLGARYILAGTVEMAGPILTVTPELVETATSRILWTDRLSRPLDALAELQQAIVAALCAALEIHVPLNEARLAEGRDISQLDAWANYHLGLRQMFLFTADGNRQAAAFFARATTLDPGFARAHAGLSFTSFQDAFLRYGPDRAKSALAARAHAERSLEIDPMDSFAAFTFGRTHWLTGELDLAASWLARATDLNPNFAQGFYSRALIAALMSQSGLATDGVDLALRLSPLDPLVYGMFGTRALSHLLQGHRDEAADWSDRAASAPHAHVLIAMIAVVANGFAGRDDRAREWLAQVYRLRPDANAELFFAAFPLRDRSAADRLRRELGRFGIA
ncbi:winged helix-turn-helix domain-containing protein [Paracoccus sp. NGMCC 1.201697]|uniref:Winged helix-turn-helix domain-containing protein n=1 Tax=Paracoccus broussonetiae subsp. drimophilus TaxID=3373869 RepID=A0ABW7LL85_9RHOB